MTIDIRGTYSNHWAPKGQVHGKLYWKLTLHVFHKLSKKTPYDKIASVGTSARSRTTACRATIKFGLHT